MNDVRNNIISIMEQFDFTRNFDNLSFYKFYENFIHCTVRLDDANSFWLRDTLTSMGQLTLL